MITPSSILIRMPNWLGDCVMALPAVAYLRRSFPKARLILAGRKNLAGLLSCQEGVDFFQETPARGVSGLVKGMIPGGSGVRALGVPKHPDLGVLLTNSLSTALWLRWLGATERVGYNRDARGMLLTRAIACDARVRRFHMVEYYLNLARAAARLSDPSLPDLFPDMEKDAAGLALPRMIAGDDGAAGAAAVLAKFGVAGPYAVIAPASAYGPVKDWPAEYYAEAVTRLNRDFALPVFITGGAEQRQTASEIVFGRDAAFNLCGETSLETFAGLLAGSAFFMGGDSGGAHLAAAFGVPTLVIFGITDPGRTRPAGRSVVLLGKGAPDGTAPKLSSESGKRLAEEALRAITPDQAVAAAEELLRTRRGETAAGT